MSLKYQGYSVVFQEVPDEVSLVISISGCPHRCPGCHSQHLWEDSGSDVLKDLPVLLQKYEGLITCLCFMGGDHCPEDLIAGCKLAHDLGLKTCLYTGLDTLDEVERKNLSTCFDYIKVGHYDATKGGLESPNTNQIFYKHKDNVYTDITSKFNKEKKHEE